MENFIEEILTDMDWRVSELATIKSMPIRYSFNPEHKKIHIKYSVPALYAIWEGFVKSTFTKYSTHLNSLAISRTEISISLLTHSLDSECNFSNPRTAFDSKKRLVKEINRALNVTIEIKPSIPTESNVNFKTLNKILERFCVSQVDITHQSGLNKLLKFRNMIAHGENSLSVSTAHIVEFVSIIENLMADIVVKVENAEKTRSYANANE